MTAPLPTVAGIPVDFILFALTLLGVAMFHHHTLRLAVIGLFVITLYKLAFTGIHEVPGLAGLLALLGREWVAIANLLGLLLGSALLARHFELSQIQALLPRYLPDDWKGGFAMLVLTFFDVTAAKQQHALQPIVKDAPAGVQVEWSRLVIVGLILLSAIGANVFFNLRNAEALTHWPVIGAAVWIVILLAAVWRPPDWRVLPDAMRGSVFLLSLVLCASMMPVDRLPVASWQSAIGLGSVSAVFDNIPPTALALREGGFDWRFLVYAVGFGGSMIWFGSSAGVALASMYPQARSVGAWIVGSWHVVVGYLTGFAILLFTLGWHPDARLAP